MIRRPILALALSLALPAAAAVPATDYTDMWWNAAESGWGVSFVQHPSDQVYAVWYTYDPREPDPATGQFKPLWIVMAGGTWTSPTSLSGPAYVTHGTPFWQPGSGTVLTPVGTFSFHFSSASTGTFTYDIAPPAGIPASDPAFNLPALSGTKPITRQGF